MVRPANADCPEDRRHADLGQACGRGRGAGRQAPCGTRPHLGRSRAAARRDADPARELAARTRRRGRDDGNGTAEPVFPARSVIGAAQPDGLPMASGDPAARCSGRGTAWSASCGVPADGPARGNLRRCGMHRWSVSPGLRRPSWSAARGAGHGAWRRLTPGPDPTERRHDGSSRRRRNWGIGCRLPDEDRHDRCGGRRMNAAPVREPGAGLGPENPAPRPPPGVGPLDMGGADAGHDRSPVFRRHPSLRAGLRSLCSFRRRANGCPSRASSPPSGAMCSMSPRCRSSRCSGARARPI